MKRLLAHSGNVITASILLIITFISPRADAVVYYWDPNGLAAPTSGTWDTTTPQWSTTSALTATPLVWDPTVAAGFPAGTAGISALSISVNSPISFAGIFNGLTSTIGVTNLVFSGSGSLNLNSGLQAFWTGSNAYNTIIRVPITGTGGVQNQSGGSLYLSGANTYSGGTSIGTSAGLNFNNSNAFGAGTITNSVGTSVLATPSTDSTGAPFATAPITISNPWQTFGGGDSAEILVGLAAAPLTFTGPWTLTSAAGTTTTLDVRITTWTISGPISGAANLTKINSAMLLLSGANTYSGKTSINNGTVSVTSLNNVVGGSASSSLGAPTTVANGTINLGASTATGTLLYTGPGETTDRVINVAGTTGGGTIQNDGTGPLTFTSDLLATNTGSKTLTLQGTNTGNNTFAGKIFNGSGTVAVTKAGAGTWTLSGANTHSGGTTLSSGGGRLNLANPSALGTGTFTIGGNSYFDNTAGSDFTVANALALIGGSPGKILIPVGSVNDGNGGANYALTFAQVATGAISPKPITVTAVTDTKVYDGTTTSTGIPTFSPAPITGDTPNFSQFFKDKNVGASKTLIPTGLVNDGNTGANYSVTFVNDTNGVISAMPITVTAVAATKVYEGTTNSVAVPTIAPGLAPGDTSEFSETYDTKNVGAGKSLTPGGSVKDGNAGANYSITFANDTNGVITAMPITVSAVATTKVYDGTTTSSGDPTVVPFLSVGDVSIFLQTYDTKNVGTAKTLTPSGSVLDGNGGTNYSVTFFNNTNGVITGLATTNDLLSSINPSTARSNVTFTATVNGAPPAADLPTGDVIFSANGIPFATNTLASGRASAITDALPAGTNAMIAVYQGDGNFLTSTGALNQIVTNSIIYSTTNIILSILNNNDGTFTLNLLGTPAAQYYLVSSPDVSLPLKTWSALTGSTNTATTPDGLWSFVVSNAAPAFYRSAAINPEP